MPIKNQKSQCAMWASDILLMLNSNNSPKNKIPTLSESIQSFPKAVHCACDLMLVACQQHFCDTKLLPWGELYSRNALHSSCDDTVSALCALPGPVSKKQRIAVTEGITAPPAPADVADAVGIFVQSLNHHQNNALNDVNRDNNNFLYLFMALTSTTLSASRTQASPDLVNQTWEISLEGIGNHKECTEMPQFSNSTGPQTAF